MFSYPLRRAITVQSNVADDRPPASSVTSNPALSLAPTYAPLAELVSVMVTLYGTVIDIMSFCSEVKSIRA
jgi:hypothetical protein